MFKNLKIGRRSKFLTHLNRLDSNAGPAFWNWRSCIITTNAWLYHRIYTVRIYTFIHCHISSMIFSIKICTKFVWKFFKKIKYLARLPVFTKIYIDSSTVVSNVFVKYELNWNYCLCIIVFPTTHAQKFWLRNFSFTTVWKLIKRVISRYIFIHEY